MSYLDAAKAIYGSKYNDLDLIKLGITVYANWEEYADFQVKFDLNNDPTTNKNILKPVPEGRDPQGPADMNGVHWTQEGFNNKDAIDAVPNGYEFAGWNTKRDGSGLKITDFTSYFEMSNAINPKVEQASITLYAQWKEIVIKIEYVADEGGTVDRVIDYVSAVTGKQTDSNSSAGNRLHSVATAKRGWHFVGWELYDEAKHGKMLRAMADVMGNQWDTTRADNSEFFIIEPDANGRLYEAKYIALFERNPEAQVEYFDDPEEEALERFGTPHGEYFTTSKGGDKFKREHHTLIGWNTKADGTGTFYKLGQEKIEMPEAGMKLYAQWEINSYGVTVGDAEKGGSVIPGSTDIEYGEKLPADFIAGLNPQPNPGWHLSGWKYTMTDPETGEVTEGFTTDLSTLTVKGPINITPVFEGADPIVDGPPRTGDTGYEFELLLAALWTALAAAIGALILLIAARRRRAQEEAEEMLAAEAAGVYGTHAAGWGDARATRMLAASEYGAHSVRKDGSRMTRAELAAQEACEDVAGCETRAEYVERAIACGMGAHAVAASALSSDNELRTSCCGAHSAAACGKGAHSIPLLADEAARGAVERLGTTEGAHTVSKAGESALDRLVAAYGAHSVRRADDGVWESFAAIVPPAAPAAPTARERMAAAVRGMRPRVSGAGAHEVAAVAAGVGQASLGQVSHRETQQVGHLSQGRLSHSAIQTAAIYAWLCTETREMDGFVAYVAPKPVDARAAKRMRKRANVRELAGHVGAGVPVTGQTRQKVPGTNCLVAAVGASSHEIEMPQPSLVPSAAQAAAASEPRFGSRTRFALGLPSVALAACLAIFGVGAHMSPSVAMASEISGSGGGASGVVSAVLGDNSASGVSSEGSSVPSNGTTAPSGVSNGTTTVPGQNMDNQSNNAATGANGAGNGAQNSSVSPDKNAGASTTNTSDKKAQNGSEGASAGSEGLEDAPGATTGDKADNTESDSKDAAGDENASADNSATNKEDEADANKDENSSKNNSAKHENDGKNATDSTHPENPATPAQGDVEGNAPVEAPADAGELIYVSSGDDVLDTSTSLTYPSNAPPLLLYDSPPGFLESGTYFIQSDYNPDYFLGHLPDR